MPRMEAAVSIKLYDNQRLYRPDTGTYVSLAGLAAMAQDGADIVVYDARTGADVTRLVTAKPTSEH